MHQQALSSVAWLHAHRHECVLVPQVLYEYWVVATRPTENNGLAMPTAHVDSAISQWTQVFRLLLDERGVYSNWRQLVSTYDVKGKTAHDARLVGAMLRHSVSCILTFNKSDFSRFVSVTAITPSEVLADGFQLTEADR
jgi:hypothetical protein